MTVNNKFDFFTGLNAALAPLAGITDSVFRRICMGFGASPVMTEMVSADGLVRGDTARTLKILRFLDCERPIGIQFFGKDPDTFAEAIRHVMHLKPDFIDINAGCPSKRIISRDCGSALMKDPELLGRIVSKAVSVADVPVTVKMRAGWDNKSINVVETALICEQAGASALIVHPRTRAQGFTGLADWNLVGEVKSRVNIPVIGSGDIKTAEEARRKMEMSCADSIMIGRAALGNPWIFRQYKELMSGVVVPAIPDIKERLALAMKQLKIIAEERNERIAVIFMRKFFGWYSKSAKNSAEFRQDIYKAITIPEVTEIIEKYLDNYDNFLETPDPVNVALNEPDILEFT